MFCSFILYSLHAECDECESVPENDEEIGETMICGLFHSIRGTFYFVICDVDVWQKGLGEYDGKQMEICYWRM